MKIHQTKLDETRKCHRPPFMKVDKLGGITNMSLAQVVVAITGLLMMVLLGNETPGEPSTSK